MLPGVAYSRPLERSTVPYWRSRTFATVSRKPANTSTRLSDTATPTIVNVARRRLPPTPRTTIRQPAGMRRTGGTSRSSDGTRRGSGRCDAHGLGGRRARHGRVPRPDGKAVAATPAVAAMSKRRGVTRTHRQRQTERVGVHRGEPAAEKHTADETRHRGQRAPGDEPGSRGSGGATFGRDAVSDEGANDGALPP